VDLWFVEKVSPILVEHLSKNQIKAIHYFSLDMNSLANLSKGVLFIFGLGDDDMA
jgi:hypothetical protein